MDGIGAEGYHTGRGSRAGRWCGQCFRSKHADLVDKLGEPSIADADVVVVVDFLLLQLTELLFGVLLLALVLLHLPQNGVFLVVL